MSAEPLLLRKNENGVATLTMNRPKARNALSRELIDAFQAELDALRDDTAIRAVVITGIGPAFCAGHDMRQMMANHGRTYFDETFAASSRMMLSIMRLPQPVIARVQATATAAGTQLVGSCDLAVAVDTAQFATPGVNIGLFCSTPMVPLSRNISRKHAMEMLVLGDPISAARAAEIGLINRVVPADGLDPAIQEMTDKITSKSALTIRIGKETFYRQLETGIEDAYKDTASVMASNMMAHDAQEGIGAFIEKREPVWRDE
jgi:enoyl-CoA hydratase/carnithine racemase